MVALVAACAGVFLASLDQTVVVTALPDIFLDIDLPVTRIDEGAWIVNGYLVGFTAALPLLGRAADVFGYRPAYAGAMLLFIAGSVLVALGDSLSWIVAARIVQAIGGGALIPVTLALASETLSPGRRGIAIGLVAAVAEGGAVLGPLYGGGMLHFAEWRWLFWINIPIGALVLLVLLKWPGHPRARGARLDLLSGLLAGAAIACSAIGISGEAALPEGVGWRIALVACGGGALIAFIARQATFRDALLPLSLLRQRAVLGSSLVNLLIGGALILALVNIPLMTDTIMGQPPLEGGLRLLRLTAMIPIGALAGGWLTQRAGSLWPLAAGLACSAAGFFLIGRWPIDVGDPRMTAELMLTGLGFGLVIAPVTVAAMERAETGQRATAAALVTVTRMTGMIIGLAALSSWGKERFDTLAGRVPLESADYEAQVSAATLTFFHEVFVVAGIVCLAGLLLAWLLPRRR
jgi:EmrB/QacA subfamily drug resistance transporter